MGYISRSAVDSKDQGLEEENVGFPKIPGDNGI